MLREEFNKYQNSNPNLIYRGESASRLDNVTDAVFGIAITLLIFNVATPDSFESLVNFTKTLPAFLISIVFLMLIWIEHSRFSRIFRFDDGLLITLNTLFIALVIFYVYPLRFLALFLSGIFFNTDLVISIKGSQVADLMIYYGFIVSGLYVIITLFYQRALAIKKLLSLSEYEIFYAREQRNRMIIMFSVPLICIIIMISLLGVSRALAPAIGGFSYFLYFPMMMWWQKRFNRKQEEILSAENE